MVGSSLPAFLRFGGLLSSPASGRPRRPDCHQLQQAIASTINRPAICSRSAANSLPLVVAYLTAGAPSGFRPQSRKHEVRIRQFQNIDCRLAYPFANAKRSRSRTPCSACFIRSRSGIVNHNPAPAEGTDARIDIVPLWQFSDCRYRSFRVSASRRERAELALGRL